MLIAVIWIDILACAWVALQLPIIKMSTSNAMSSIEENFLAPDLSDEKKSQFASLKQLIEGNQTTIMSSLKNTRTGAVLIGCILLIQNLALLSILRTRKCAEHVEGGKASPATS